MILKENIVFDFYIHERTLTDFQERDYFKKMTKEFTQDTKVKINNKIYDAKISLRDFDKVENFNEKIKNHNNKVERKNNIAIGISIIALFISLILLWFCLFNLSRNVICIIFLIFISMILSWFLASDDFRYFLDIYYKIAVNFKNWIENINLDENLCLIIQNNSITISGIEKGTEILNEFESCVPSIKYHDKDFVLIESFVTEKEEFKYNFKVLLPLELKE